MAQERDDAERQLVVEQELRDGFGAQNVYLDDFDRMQSDCKDGSMLGGNVLLTATSSVGYLFEISAFEMGVDNKHGSPQLTLWGALMMIDNFKRSLWGQKKAKITIVAASEEEVPCEVTVRWEL
jgi:hypothetical protein